MCVLCAFVLISVCVCVCVQASARAQGSLCQVSVCDNQMGLSLKCVCKSLKAYHITQQALLFGTVLTAVAACNVSCSCEERSSVILFSISSCCFLCSSLTCAATNTSCQHTIYLYVQVYTQLQIYVII